MSLQRKSKGNTHPIFYIIIAIIAINIIAAFPILIVFIAIWFFKWNINLEKILQNTGINNFLKKQFWSNYEKIISEIKKSKKYQTRVKNNRQTRNQVEDLFTDNQWNQIDGEDMTISAEEKFKKMQRELEDKKNKEKIFYQQNQKTLQDKLSQSSKIKVEEKQKKYSSNTSSYQLNSTKKSHKNYFWNSTGSSSFWEGKSIWDSYESVTDKFSSNKK